MIFKYKKLKEIQNNTTFLTSSNHVSFVIYDNNKNYEQFS